MIKSRSIRLVGHVACVRRKKDGPKVLVRKPQGKNLTENPDINGRNILKQLLKK